MGERTGALGREETVTLAVVGTHGQCTIPAGATGIITNTTIVNPTDSSYLTLFPADAPRPFASNLNWVAGQPPTPNLASVGLSAGGAINVFNLLGTVHVIIDITSYLTPGGGGGTGPAGPPGPPGPPGPVQTAGNWGVIDRNTAGSPVANLRSGPSSPALTDDPENPIDPGAPGTAPPFGTGSLGLGVAEGERASFGNQTDFFNTPFNVTAVGFQVYNVGENVIPGIDNMPGITFEIDPNVAAFDTNYSSLVFVPNNTLPGWSAYIDGTNSGLWGLTGSAFAGQQCSLNGPRCTWTEILAFLNDGGDTPTLFTVAVTKGIDEAWHGAVDGLRINAIIYNFDEYGVTTQAA